MKMFKLDHSAVAFASTSLGSALLNSVFGFYYVHVYLSHFNVSESGFQIAQIIFLIWNAINDPLFGYVQDHCKGTVNFLKTRRHSILYGAPFFAISFMVVWIPWTDYSDPANQWLSSVQLTVALCFWDSLFTFVLLAQCALSTEMSTNHSDRIKLIRYSRVASLMGHSSVFFANFVSSNLEDYNSFLAACFVIAILACASFVYTGLHAHTEYDLKTTTEPQEKQVHNTMLGAQEMEEIEKIANHQPSTDENTPLVEVTSTSPEATEIEYSVTSLFCQIFAQPSFLSFVFMNLCQIYLSTFMSNFTKIFSEALTTKEYMSPTIASVYYGLVTLSPSVIVILGTGVLERVGYFKIIQYSFYVKIASGATLYLLGPKPWALLLFFLVESVECHATFSLFNLPLSDIIDVDQQKYKRNHPQSSMVFGTNALITKPAVSFAPMLTVAILNRYGYNQMKTAIEKNTVSSLQSASFAELQNAMFYTACITPIAVGLLQIIVWSFYTIRHSHTVVVKHSET